MLNLEVWHLVAVFELPFGLEEMAGVNKFKGLESSRQITWISFHAIVSVCNGF